MSSGSYEDLFSGDGCIEIKPHKRKVSKVNENKEVRQIKTKILDMMKCYANYPYSSTEHDIAIAFRDLYVYIEEEIEHSRSYNIIEIIKFLDIFKEDNQ